MQVFTKFEVTCEKKNPSLKDRITLNKKKVFYIWAIWIINWFREKIDSTLFSVISIKPTDDKMEIFWNANGPFFDEEIQVTTIKL